MNNQLANQPPIVGLASNQRAIIQQQLDIIDRMSTSPQIYKENCLKFHYFGHLFGGNIGATLAHTWIIGGKPALTADGIWGRVVESGNVFFQWKHTSSESVTLYCCRTDIKLQNSDELCDLKITFTLADMKAQGIARGNQWTKYPMNMLMARAKSFMARSLFSEVAGGLYAVEELNDSSEMEVMQALNVQPSPSNPPQQRPQLEYKRPQQSPQQAPIRPPSNPPPIPPKVQPPKPKFDPSKSLTSDDLISQLSTAGFNGTLIMNNTQALGNILNLLDNDEDKVKIGRLCFEGPRLLGIVTHMRVNALNLGSMDYWHSNKESRLLKTPFELACNHNFNEEPWDYYRPFLS